MSDIDDASAMSRARRDAEERDALAKAPKPEGM